MLSQVFSCKIERGGLHLRVLMSKSLEQCRDENLNKQLHVDDDVEVVETNTLKRVDVEAAASDCCIMRIFSQKYSSSSLT